MRKILLLIAVSIFLAGCDSAFKDDYSIQNSSSNAVTFTIKETDDDVYSLAVDEIKTYNLYDYPKITILSKNHQTFSYSDGDVTIKDMQKYTVEIENQTLKTVTVTETNDLLENYGDSISLDTAKSTTVYTYGLSFSAIDSDGTSRECVLTKNSENYLLVVR